MRKALEVLGNETFVPPTASFLSGEEVMLKVMVKDRILEKVGIPKNEIERYTAKTAEQAAIFVGEGSLFGRRLVMIELEGKWGRTQALREALREAKENEDVIVISATSMPDKSQSLNPLLTEIECKKLIQKKQRYKLITCRLPYMGLTADEEVITKLAERTDGAAEIHIALQILKYTARDGVINLKEVEKTTEEPAQRRDITRAVLTQNTTRLAKEINEGEPLLILTILHGTLLKLYVWLEANPEDEEKTMEALELTKRRLKDWKAARTKYSAIAVRRLLEKVSDAYQIVTTGRTGNWRHVLQMAFRDL